MEFAVALLPSGHSLGNFFRTLHSLRQKRQIECAILTINNLIRLSLWDFARIIS